METNTMSKAEDYAKIIESAIRFTNVKEIRIRTIKEGLESYAEQVAKEHLEQTLIDFTEHAKFADGFDRDIIKSFLNKQQP